MVKTRAADDTEQWRVLGNCICEVLSVAYCDEPKRFREWARKEGTTMESLVAAAICGMLEQEWGVRLERAPASRVVKNGRSAKKRV